MHLDKNTFGSSPAAIYLADTLNQRQDRAQSRRATRILSAYGALAAQLEKANVWGILRVRLVDRLLGQELEFYKALLLKDDDLVSNLILNILVGKKADYSRRVREVRLLQRAEARAQGEATFDLSAIAPDSTKDQRLIYKSIKKLEKYQKVSTLY